jgi:three-Cys-motif partner protein
MPPKETIWDAESHTIAKHRILQKYLGGWLPVISSWNKRVLFIDGFSGPGGVRRGRGGLTDHQVPQSQRDAPARIVGNIDRRALVQLSRRI